MALNAGAPTTGAGWRQTLARAAYGATCAAVAPLSLPLLALHPRLRGALGQRLGLAPSCDQAPVWLHGSSAGDVVALAPLASRLGAAGLSVVVSAWTRAGHQMADQRLGDQAAVFRAPLDLGGPVVATLDRLRPRGLVLECLELWPRLVLECSRRGIPVAVVNGRLSSSSLSSYQRLAWLFRPCFASLRLVVALSQQHARRFVAAGVPARRVVVQPSSKHAGLALRALGPADVPPRVVLGSLHRAEEQILLPCLEQLLAAVPGLRVLLAPRYPHRAAAVQRRLRRLGLASSLQSRAPEARGVVILDVMGQLAAQYHGAALAFVGGSLVPRGGHNVMEPAACGVPILLGPHCANVRHEVRALRRAGAAQQVADGPAFLAAALALLRDPAAARQAGAAGQAVARRFAGAADHTAALLLGLVERAG